MSRTVESMPIAVVCADVRPRTDPAAAGLLAAAHQLGITMATSVNRSRLIFLRCVLTDDDRSVLARRLLADELCDDVSWDRTEAIQGGHVIEVVLRAGVTDPLAAAVRRGALGLGYGLDDVATGWRFEVGGNLDSDDIDRLTRRLLANDVVERACVGLAEPQWTTDAVLASGECQTVAIVGLAPDELMAVGRERRLSLDPAELTAIQKHFEALERDPTDVELEALAQTWSEHCNHKTFRAALRWDDGQTVPSLLAQLRAVTDTLNKPWVHSAFVDNAGIVAFDDYIDVAIKAETHNHPSAIEPFGGANTGVGGVIRDVVGVSAQPIALTDILCFGPGDLPVDELPAGVLHPTRIRDGVIAGVADYGNKIGVPTVSGAIIHDPGFVANPLVFCGAIGVLPVGSYRTGANVGDRVVVIGGRTGRDGIRGATFSSMAMDATTGEVAGASVQIGDPVVEQAVIEVVIAARDAELYTAITDCGAGGLSSAVGEMADGVGARVELDLVPLKYAGLEPWEVWLSEAQERMVLAVPAANVSELEGLCQRFEVDIADIGEFTGDGHLVVDKSGTSVLDLDTAFLHGGCPRRTLVATRPTPAAAVPTAARVVDDSATTLLALLAHPSMRSNLDVVRGYDHEILGGSVVRPYGGAADDGPRDAAVVRPLGADPSKSQAIALGIGVNVRYGRFDCRRMAEAVVDEAIRNVVAVGADPDRVALLDNFSWGDVSDPAILGQLIEAVGGCSAAALAHGAPYVSGKDSLNNAFVDSNGVRQSIPPTLVIHALGVVPDLMRSCTSDLKQVGDVVVFVGSTQDELVGSHLDAVLGIDGPGGVPGLDPDAPHRYRSLHRLISQGYVTACHDLSEGGLAVAAAEMAIAGRLGLELDVGKGDEVVELFSESTGRFLVTCRPDDAHRFAEIGRPLGVVTLEPLVRIGSVSVTIDALVHAWAGHIS